MHRHDDALELLTTKGNQDAAAYDRIAAFDGIGEDAVHRHGQRDITKKRHKECLHQGGEAGNPPSREGQTFDTFAAQRRGSKLRHRSVRSDEELVEMCKGALLRQFCGGLVITGAHRRN